MKKLLMLCLLSITACATESAPTAADTDDTVSSAASEISVSLPTGAKPADVTCFQLWRCRSCGGTRTQNYLQDKCSDGTTTIDVVGPCGEACF